MCLASDSAPLPGHLFTRGFVQGRHSDISIQAFGNTYHLHRLLLDRAPFFSSALSEPWLESTAKELTLNPSDIDPNISQDSFELALKRLYGIVNTVDQDKEAMGLFATACWLEMTDLVDSAIDSLLREF